MAFGPYRIVDKISLGVICIQPANTSGATLRVKQADITKYDELAVVLAQPARWLEPTGGIQTPEGVEVGEIALEDEDPEAEQELWYGAAHNAEGVPPGQRQLPIQATVTKGRVLGLYDTEQSILYQAIVFGGKS